MIRARVHDELTTGVNMSYNKRSRKTNVLRSLLNQVTQRDKVTINKVLHTAHLINKAEDDFISDLDKVIYEPNKVT